MFDVICLLVCKGEDSSCCGSVILWCCLCHCSRQDPIRQTVVAPDQVQYYFQLAQHHAVSMQQQQQQQQQGQQAPQQAPPPQQQPQMASQVQQQQVTVSTQPQAIITSVPQQQIVTMAVSLKAVACSTFSTLHMQYTCFQGSCM